MGHTPDPVVDTEPAQRLLAPWTPAQVDALNDYQSRGWFHPYTCPNRSDAQHWDWGQGDKGVLVATTDGWTCRDCDYTQNWAHAFSAAPSAPPTLGPTPATGEARDATKVPLAWGEMPYDTSTVGEVVHDFAVVRGDLSEQYARDQLTSWVERLVVEKQAQAWAAAAAWVEDHDPGWGEDLTNANPYRAATGPTFPQTPEDARVCVHANTVWVGHECGLCDDAGAYTFLDVTALGMPRVEWAVEVTWADWKRAGAKGPTSQYDGFETPDQLEAFLDVQRRHREIVATRVLARMAAYGPWVGPQEPDPVTEEEREARLQRLYEQMVPGPRPLPNTGADDA